MQIELAANDSIKLNDMTVSIKDGKLAVSIDIQGSVAQTLNNLVGAVRGALLPLMSQGIQLPDIKMPENPLADPIAHVSAIVAFAAVDGLKQQAAKAIAAAQAANDPVKLVEGAAAEVAH